MANAEGAVGGGVCGRKFTTKNTEGTETRCAFQSVEVVPDRCRLDLGLSRFEDPPEPEADDGAGHPSGGPLAAGGDGELAGVVAAGVEIEGADVGEATVDAAAREIADGVAATFAPGEDAADAIGPDAEQAVADGEPCADEGKMRIGEGIEDDVGVERVIGEESLDIAHAGPHRRGGEREVRDAAGVDAPVGGDGDRDAHGASLATMVGLAESVSCCCAVLSAMPSST